ncbi:hypothetical protein EES43_20795 [Streptomyces sp. ADI96-02]|uniref:hypothetical protein n=1 Tax=Streptomyces sp. ADI96-02 TaxID=1522760 RepID=UPI000F559881|nr:hypothetical protein [Streptomyces sp. ADI96-02]RPK57788.1 hypothetical protein EES43_20795 [Streptomyces sp. ADI96-02]
MSGDERTQPYAGDAPRVRTGPRHAAPRKSLLTKLHLPSGKKAFALAAMPTAVFVGMGLTPRLALADGNPDLPFAPGPCVTRSDEPSASESPEPTPSPSATAKDEEPGRGDPPAPTPSAGETTPDPSAASGAGQDPAGGKRTDAKAGGAKEGGAAADRAARSAKEQPAETPSPTESRNPLDPLGLGDALKDLFDGPDEDEGEDKAGAEEPSTPSPSPTTPSPALSPAPSERPKAPAEDPAGKAKETSDRTADAIREAAEKAGADVEELDEDVKGLDPRKDEDIPDGAKPRFPCPEPDPDALAAAELEPGIPLLPSDPWILESSKLTLKGLDYKGIVEVKKADGSIKKALKFTATSIDIDDLHQLTTGPAGTTGHVRSRPGSTSEIRNGTVTMYTEELKGNLLGFLPITFSPESPPPLNLPFVWFTKVKVTQAGQFGGTLTVPGLRNYLDGGDA